MSTNTRPQSDATSGQAPPSLFSWASFRNSPGTVVLRPWLTVDEKRVVQGQFKTPLTFGRVEDVQLGLGTTITPAITVRKNQEMVEGALMALWHKQGVDPRVRLRHGPNGRPASASVPTGSVANTGFTQTSPSSISKQNPSPPPREVLPDPRIVFSVSAYLKYRYMCNAHGGHTEVGGYGIHTLEGKFGNVIRVSEFATVSQQVDPVFCSLDPAGANDLMVRRCLEDETLTPPQVLACWCHTHPGGSVTPSYTDWNTFAEHAAFAWSAMIIMAKDGTIGAHIRQQGPLGPTTKEVRVTVDWENFARPEVVALLRPDEWEREYMENIWPSAQSYHPDNRPAGTTASYGQLGALFALARENVGRVVDHDDDHEYRLTRAIAPPPAGSQRRVAAVRGGDKDDTTKEYFLSKIDDAEAAVVWAYDDWVEATEELERLKAELEGAGLPLGDVAEEDPDTPDDLTDEGEEGGTPGTALATQRIAITFGGFDDGCDDSSPRAGGRNLAQGHPAG